MKTLYCPICNTVLSWVHFDLLKCLKCNETYEDTDAAIMAQQKEE